MQFPIADPVLIVALTMAILLIVPLLFERLRVPGIIGLLVAGATVGPNGAGLLERDGAILLLGTVGLLYLVFLAGLELDLNRFLQFRRQSVVFGAISFGAPAILALAISPMLGFGLPAVLLLSSIVGTHTLLAYPIVSRLGLTKNAAVTTVVGGTLVTDTLGLAILAVVSGVSAGDAGPAFWIRLLGLLVLYVVLVLWAVPRIGRWFFRRAPGQAPGEFIFLMLVLFTSAFLAGLAGAQPVIGAFLAGLALNRLIPENGPLMNRVRFIGNALLIPFFLISVGMLVDPRVLAGSARVWTIAGATLLFVTVGKFAAAWIARRGFRYSGDEGMLIFGLSVPQAAATLAVTFIGLEIGLFDETVVNGIIILILATGLIGPSLVERYGRRVALAEEERPYEPSEAPQRILIPVSNPATAEALLDLAFVLRDPKAGEPVHPLMVVTQGSDGSEAQVAEAERMLGHAVIYAAGAEVPTVPLTRVDRNIATGIARGIAETRSSTVIIGWDGRITPGKRIFGSVLDQLLEQTRQLVLVAKLGHPLNTTERIFLVLPPGADHSPGFFDSLRTVKTMAAGLGAAVIGVVVTDDAERYRERFEVVKPKVPATFAATERWGALLRELRGQLRSNDLVVVLSARRGRLAWHPKLERLPAQLARLVPESFIMIYPSEVEPVEEPASRGEALPRALTPERIVVDLPRLPFHEAVVRMLQAGYGGYPERLRELAELLVQNESEFSTEVLPGVVVPHARVEGLTEPMLFLGISREGIEFPKAAEPVHLIFLLLSPIDDPEAHLRLLAEIARLVSNPERLQKLVSTYVAPDTLEWLPAAGV